MAESSWVKWWIYFSIKFFMKMYLLFLLKNWRKFLVNNYIHDKFSIKVLTFRKNKCVVGTIQNIRKLHINTELCFWRIKLLFILLTLTYMNLFRPKTLVKKIKWFSWSWNGIYFHLPMALIVSYLQECIHKAMNIKSLRHNTLQSAYENDNYYS